MSAAEYQTARLWSGIASITAGCALAVSAAMAARAGVFDGWPFALAALVVAFGIVVAMAPADALCGWAVERALGRTGQAGWDWLADWARVALPHALAVAGAIGAFALAAEAGLAGRLGIIAALMVAAFAGFCFLGGLVPRGWVAARQPEFESQLRAELAELGERAPDVRWIDPSESRAVDGGWIGWPGRRLFLTAGVARHLSPREAALMVARECEAARRGLPPKAFFVAAAWLGAGALGAASIPGPDRISHGVTGMAAMTLWSLAALFVLPAISRRWNVALDRWLAGVAAPGEAAALLAKVQSLNATDTELPGAKTAVFHPIPPLAARLDRMS